MMTAPTLIFPNAPEEWSSANAESHAADNGITLAEDHWILIQCLQEYYNRNEFPKLRHVTDALDERFHAKGGMKYLHRLLPQGPISMGCELAGLDMPAGWKDKSFGTAA